MTDESTWTATDYFRDYARLAHAMQTGVASEEGFDPKSTTPKHLRVGVNSALVDSGSLAGLLIAKGVITELEYAKALRDGMQREVDKYQQLVNAAYGGRTQITLV